ncbi:hypothetical protein ABPG72_006832 [Tetrahymena utriculariae]
MSDKELRLFELILILKQMIHFLSVLMFQIIKDQSWQKYLDMDLFLSLIVFLVCFIGYCKIDGLRVNIITIIFAEMSIVLEKSNFISTNFRFLNTQLGLLFTLLSTIMYFTFPVLKQVTISGQFRIGFIQIDISGTQVSIFYPTEEKYKKNSDVNYLPSSDYFDTLHFIIQRSLGFKVALPKWLIKISGQPMAVRQMGVIKNANLKILDTNMQLVIYSHGLSSNRNYQATFCKELASKGCIVISLQHRDEEYLEKVSIPPQQADFVNTMYQATLRRKQQVSQILDFAFDTQKFVHIFQNKEKNKNLSLNDKVLMCGHSYGGQTAILSALEDDRIFATISLDPVMNIFDLPLFKPLIEKRVNKPFMILCSDNFNKLYPCNQQKEGLSVWISNNKNSKNLLLPLRMRNTEHLDMIDAALFQPRELQIVRKDVYSPNRVTKNITIINKLTEIFIFEVFKNNHQAIDCQRVFENFQQICKDKIKIPNPFEIIKE